MSDLVLDAWAVARGRQNAKDAQVARRYHGLLILRFALVNLVAVALLAAAYVNGWVQAVIEGDDTGLSVTIFISFLAGLAVCTHKVWRVSAELDRLKGGKAPQNAWVDEYLSAIAGHAGRAGASA